MNKSLFESIDSLKMFVINEDIMYMLGVPVTVISLYYGKDMVCLSASNIISFNVFEI